MNGLATTVRKALLGCGVAASVLYIATDIIGAMRYPGYHYADQQISELFANGSPVRPFMVALNGVPYNLLLAAFAVGVWVATWRRLAGRVTAGLLGGYTVASTVGGLFFPMATREAMAAGQEAWHNTMHLPVVAAISICLVLAMGIGATLLGGWFRWYSYGTIATLLAFGGLVSTQVTRIEANQPTPWMGIAERVNIYASMLWIAILAVGLWRAQEAVASRQPGRLTPTPQGMQAVPR